MSTSLLSSRSRSQAQGHGHAAPTNAREYDCTQSSFMQASVLSGTGATTFLEGSLPSYSLQQSGHGVLSREMIAQGLSNLGKTGDWSTVAFLSLSLPDLGLTDLTLISSYTYLQNLDLSSNGLTDISVLGNLPYLVWLDVSNNKLSTILDFVPPKNLKEVNYSHNEIEEIPDLSVHQSLSVLTLDSNQIPAISGLVGLRCLSHLSLAENRVEQMDNLDHLPLKHLNLSGNCITKIENLETLTSLQVLDLSGNKISSLKGLQVMQSLEYLNMEENQVVSLNEVLYLKDLCWLRSLSLKNNPVQELLDYNSTVPFYLPSLIELDGRKIIVEEKVAASNRFAPPLEVVAALNHISNVAYSAKKQARLKFSTLTSLDEPYPLLVLCGPPGSGKSQLCKLLVEEFPGFFGIGVSHTTRPQRPRESHGKDYYFIDEGIFNKVTQSGEFIQTCRSFGYSYGLTNAVIEQVAQQGYACVTHMDMKGVLELKKTHFEPRYILTIPLTPQVHEQRLKAKNWYTDEQVKQILESVQEYRERHQDWPGFFDTAFNTDSLHDAYSQLRALVMAYGGIAPESPISLSMSASRPTSQRTSSPITSPSPSLSPSPSSPSPSEQTSQFNTTGVCTAEQSMFMGSHNTTTLLEATDNMSTNATRNIHNMAKAWSRPGSCVSSRPASRAVSEGIAPQQQQWNSKVKQRAFTPVSEQFNRRQLQIKAALTGKETPVYGSVASSSRPGTVSKPESQQPSGVATPYYSPPVPQVSRKPPGSPTASPSAASEEEDSQSESTSSEHSHGAESSMLSKLSSARGISPQHASDDII